MHWTARLILSLLLFTLAACSDPPPPVVEEAVLPDYSHIVCKPSVHPFWTKFREAVLKEDWEAVAELTEFPLMWIPLDRSKTQYISRQEFIKQFPQRANAPLGNIYPPITPKPDSMKELIRTIPTLHKSACGELEEQLDIGHWTFIARTEGWRLAVVGVNELSPPK